MSIPWDLKPLAGLVSDSLPLFGTRRRHYLLVGASAAGILWFLMGVVPRTFASLVLVAMLLNVALGYSLMMSVWNISASLSDIFGSWLFDHYHLNFMNLVWLNAGTTALVLIAVPFLPGSIVAQREGEHRA